MRVIVNVQLKNGVLDPQGKAVHHALSSLKFSGVNDVRIGKQIILEINENDKESAQKYGKSALLILEPLDKAGLLNASQRDWSEDIRKRLKELE